MGKRLKVFPTRLMGGGQRYPVPRLIHGGFSTETVGIPWGGAIVIKDRWNIMIYTEHPCIASSSTFKKERDAWKLWETSHLVHTLNNRLTCVEENGALRLGETAGKKKKNYTEEESCTSTHVSVTAPILPMSPCCKIRGLREGILRTRNVKHVPVQL